MPLIQDDARRAYQARFAPDGRSLLVAHFEFPTRLWTIPGPIPPSVAPDRARLWVEVLTGQELGSGSSARFLDAVEWRRRRDKLGDLADFDGTVPARP